jgi:hypothetical protein
MSEQPKGLDQKTIDRISREWDKGVIAKKPFSVHGAVVFDPYEGEQDVIVVKKTDSRGETYQNVIRAYEMDNDIKPRQTSKKLPHRGTPPQK